MPTQPLIVDVTRGPAVESRHQVHAVIMDGTGNIKAQYGDASRPTFPRSAIKPLQAIALVESGAASAFGLSNAEIALACASHGGEEKHVSTAGRWLARIGLDETALECGAHAPYSAPNAAPCVLCNNCSGKHSGMVTLALHMNVPVQGYTNITHPAQARLLQAVGQICDTAISAESCGTDGCSAPNPMMPLRNMGLGFSRFMRPDGLGILRGTACRHLYQAMVEHPDLVAGTGRVDTVLMAAAKGEMMCKVGGEGVYACVIPRHDTVIALKVEDGAVRAAYAAIYALLEKYKLAAPEVLQAAHELAQPTLKNWRGIETGVIRV